MYLGKDEKEKVQRGKQRGRHNRKKKKKRSTCVKRFGSPFSRGETLPKFSRVLTLNENGDLVSYTGLYD